MAWEAISNALQRSSVREQRMVVAAAIVIGLAAGWLLIWNPMTADIERLARDVPRAQSVLAAARAQADSLIALQRTPPVPRTQAPLASVERVLAERNLRSAVSALDVSEGRVRLTFAAVRFDAIPGLLDALNRVAGVRAADATLAPRVEPGLVRAEFSLIR